MVRISNIKIPSVRVGSIDPTSNIGVGGATPAPPTPITYLTQWKIVGNSEVHGNEIWSCGEYNPTDGKYHILVQPLGGIIADIALDAPLRKVNDVADTIEFANGVAIVTRTLGEKCLYTDAWYSRATSKTDIRWSLPITFIPDIKPQPDINVTSNLLCNCYLSVTAKNTFYRIKGIAMDDRSANIISIYDPLYVVDDDKVAFIEHLRDVVLVYELNTPTTDLVDAPQIQEAESYSMVISQGAKAVEWSSFETNGE